MTALSISPGYYLRKLSPEAMAFLESSVCLLLNDAEARQAALHDAEPVLREIVGTEVATLTQLLGWIRIAGAGYLALPVQDAGDGGAK